MSENEIAELYRRLSSMEATIVGLSRDIKYQNEIQASRISRLEDCAKESKGNWTRLAFGILQNAIWAVIAGYCIFKA
jgi:hypothetical protein